MSNTKKIYVAVRLDNGRTLRGAKGQTTFESKPGLNKSLAHDYWLKDEALKKDCKVRDLYDIIEYELTNGRIVE